MPYAFNDKQVAQKLVQIAKGTPAGVGPRKVRPAKGEGWIFQTPAGGIPARSGSTAGSATCTAYFINDSGVLTAITGTASSVKVYNPFSTAVAGSTWITAKTVHGKPVVDAEDCPP